MEELSLRNTRQQASDALSWQYIILLVVFALLVPLVSSSLNVERADKPIVTQEPQAVDFTAEAYQGLNELPLTQTYDDVSGISVSYPEEWFVLPLSPGFFVVSNHELDLNAVEFPADIVLMQVQIGELASFTMPDGSTPAAGITPAELLAQLTADAPETFEIVEFTVDDSPAASIEIAATGSVRSLTLITPNERDLVVVDSSSADGLWSNVEGLLGNILQSFQLNIVSS